MPISTSRQSSYVSSLSVYYGRLNCFSSWTEAAATPLDYPGSSVPTQRMSGHLKK